MNPFLLPDQVPIPHETDRHPVVLDNLYFREYAHDILPENEIGSVDMMDNDVNCVRCCASVTKGLSVLHGSRRRLYRGTDLCGGWMCG